MKADYIRRLKAQLQEFDASYADVDDIINDYGQLYDDAIATGKSDEEVYTFLGKPEKVAYDLIDTLKIKHHKDNRNKIVALMPFISVIIYMILGFGYGWWSTGWLVFLLIPVSGIVFNTSFKNGFIALTPFITVIVYLVLGFVYDLWNPGWLVFFLIPMSSIILNTRFKDMFIALSPFVAVIVFMLIGTYYEMWNPGWLVFLIIPMIGLLHSNNIWKIIVSESAIIIAIAFYLYMGYVQGSWTIGAFGFILPIAVSLLFGDITISGVWSLPRGPHRKKTVFLLATIFFSIALFLALGLALEGWAYAWQVFLLIPVVSILAFDKFRFTSISPFVAVVLFFSIGYFFHAFNLSWLAFLIIPMAGILENA